MTTTTTDMTTEAKAFITATVTPDETLDIDRKHGYHGKTRAVRVEKVTIRWVIDFASETPAWRSHEKVHGRNLRADGTLGAPTDVWEYGYYRDERPDRVALNEFVKAAIESTRPAIVPTLKIEA